MYKRYLLIVILALPLTSMAQDTIVKRNGEELLGKVTELTDTEVKYRKQENLEGPVYSIKKAEVLFIRYANGYKEVISTETQPTVNASDANTLDPIIRKFILEKKRNGKQFGFNEQSRIKITYSASDGRAKNLSGVIVDIKENSLLIGTELVPIEKITQVRYKHPNKRMAHTLAYGAAFGLGLAELANGPEKNLSMGVIVPWAIAIVGLVAWDLSMPEKHNMGNKWGVKIVGQ